MPSHPNQFKLSPRGMLLALVSAALSNAAFANTGNVNFAIGNITVTNANGNQRPLTKGTEIRSGDKVASGSDGRAQIRFSDGAFVSLQPNTEFNIREYRFNGAADGSESALFGLLKGAMRTVTGLVGRTNRDKYQIATPTATIGIRGTGGLISIAADGTTRISGTSGTWLLSNAAGSIEVPARSAGVAGPNQNQPPQQTSEGPSVPPAQQQTQTASIFTENENRDVSGKSTSLAATLISGPGYILADADGGEYGGDINVNVPVDAIFDGAGRLTQFTKVYEGTDTYILRGTHAESGTDGILAWGRWTGQVDIDGYPHYFDPNQGVHYVIGTPTPYASLPSGMQYTYNMIGATNPTVTNGSVGSVGPGTLAYATLTGNFSTYEVMTSFGGTIGGMTFDAHTSGSIHNIGGAAAFSSSGSFTGTLNSGESSASAVGFFAGPGATRAGMTYSLSNTNLLYGSTVVGAAALGLTSTAPAPIPD